jgi:hypothetical protein
MSLGSNLLGAMVGGCIEYLSMFVGLRAVALVALAIYIAAFLVLKLQWRPAPIWNRRAVIGALAAGVAGMALLVALAAKSSSTDDTTSQAERRWIRANRIADAKSKLRTFGSNANPADVAETCKEAERLDASMLSAGERDQCGQAHLSLARDLLAKGKSEEARRAINAARLELPAASPALADLDNRIRAAEGRTPRHEHDR